MFDRMSVIYFINHGGTNMANYVASNLNRGENIVFQAKRTRLYLVGTWVKGILLCFLLLIPLIKAIIITIAYFHCELAITNKRVVGRVGLIKTESLDTSLNKVQNITVENGFWGKFFGYGTVTIRDAAGMITFAGIKNPEEFKRTLMSQIESYEQDHIKEQAMQMASAMAGALNK